MAIQTTIMIEDDQVDIAYNYSTVELTIFINGIEITHHHFSPSRAVFNTINMIQLAVEVRGKWKKRIAEENKINNS